MRKRVVGFTLIELMVVIAIIIILAAIGIITYFNLQKAARDTKRRSDLGVIQTNLEQYHADKNYYPAALTEGGELSKYLAKIPSDPTGGDYAYTYQGLDCDTSGQKCSSYKITAQSEENPGGIFVGTPNSNEIAYVGPTSAPTITSVPPPAGGGTSAPTATPTTAPPNTPTSTPTPVSTPALPTNTPTPTSTLGPIATPTPVPCALNSAYWETTTATAGNQVRLFVGSNSCRGYTVYFSVREADVGGYDSVNINPAPVTFPNIEGQVNVNSSWIAEWQEDCLGLCNPPEYYFVATVDGSSSIQSDNQLVVVNPVSSPAPTPTSTPSPTPTQIPTPTPTPAPKRVFVTSSTYQGNLGGLSGADAKCQALGGGLGGTWKAWLSNDTESPVSRFTHNQAPYKLLDGTIIANNWDDLIDGSLLARINLTETNNRLIQGWDYWIQAWTGTSYIGYATVGATCNNWTIGSAQPGVVGAEGAITFTNSYWTSFGQLNCNNTFHLYCFEQ